jgi:hypothetical protein
MYASWPACIVDSRSVIIFIFNSNFSNNGATRDRMLSSLFSSVLSKVLRKYFKGFESRNIKFNLSGEVDLLDLELEETALDDLHLPLKIKQGYVGKLQLIVPWQNLGEHSTIVRVSDVLIIVGPKSFDEVCAIHCYFETCVLILS